MSTIWNKERIKKAKIAPRIGIYETIPQSTKETQAKQDYPDIFKFKNISIGDGEGQAFFVPLDESSCETAEYILRAIKAYKGE